MFKGYIILFNYLYKELLEYDNENGYSQWKLLKQLTDGILDKSYTILKRQARHENWDLDKFQ